MKKLFLLLLVSLLALMSTVYFVSCSENDFGVNFVVDGEDYASISINGNDDVNMPADPTKEGYIFDGWYFDEGVWQAPFAAEQLINGYLSDSMTVYAKWVESHIHIPSEWIIDSEATCKEPGKKHTECTECGAIVENAIIEKSEEHVVVVDPRVEPTDTSNGLTEGSHCGVCGKVLVAQTVISAQLQGAEIASSSLTVVDEKISGSLGNSMASFSFMNDISVAPGASYIVASDEKFKNTIDDKIASLEIGDNVFYILVTNGSTSKSYTVVIRRLPTYTVRFVTAGGTAVRSQTVEEGSLATAPVTSRTGYTFKGWNFDFTTKITEDITVEASWEANTDTVYKVEYYLENIHKTGYEYPIVENFSGTTASTVTAELKEFKHFKFNEAISVTSGSVNADGSLVLKVYYLRDTYGIDALVNDDARGTVEGGGTYAYGKEITLIATDKPGYIFLGWFEGDFTVCCDAEFTFKVEGDASYTAKWTEDTNTLYTVEYYLENAKKTDFDAPIVQVMAGTTNALVTAEQKEFEHFTFLDTAENVLSGNIDANGNLVLKVYYTRDTYDVAVSVNDSDRGTALGAGNYIYGETVTLTATDKRGYTFLGWFDEQGNAVKNAGDAVRENNTYPYTYIWTFEAGSSVNCVAKWDLSTDTRYTVEYYLENSDKSGYPVIADQTEMLTGTTFDKVTAEIKEFEHFTFADISSNVLDGTIAPEGNLVLKVYYSRNTYDVSASVDEEKHGAITGAGTFAYDQKITLTATPNPGYVFVGWYEGDDKVCEELVYTFNANHSATYTAKWVNATDTKYKVEYYLEAYEYDEHNKPKYELVLTTDLEGTTHDVIDAEQKVFEHFEFLDTEQNVLSGEIAPDGSLVLKVYYSRNKYFIDNQEGGYITGATGRWFRYEDTVTLTASSYNGHYFIGWYLNGELYSKEADVEFKVIGNLEACFDLKDELKYFEFNRTSGEYNIIGVKEEYKSLTEIVVPSYITGIDEGAFAGCSNLEKLTIPFIGLGKMSGSTVPTPYPLGIIFGESQYDGSVAVEQIYDNSGYIDVVEETATYYLPASLSEVTVIKNDIPLGAFSGCANIKKVTLGETVSTLADKAFYECKGLESIDFEGNTRITSVGYQAFYGCESLKSVKMGNAVKTIGSEAFWECKSLESVQLGNAVETIGRRAFYNCASLKTVELPETVTSISEAFYCCTGLESIVIPNGVTTIEQDDFKYCSNLKSVTIGNGVTTIGNRAFGSDIYVGFDGFTKLETLIIGNNVTTIGEYAFYDCSSLTSIEIPDSVTSIGVSAFSGCSAVTSLTIGSGISTISNYTFAHMTNLASVSIPTNVEIIGDYAFWECTSLEEVIIPDSITSIGNNAFDECTSLETVTVSAGVESIGDSAFARCTSLKSINVEAGNTNYMSIDGNLYTKDGKTLLQYAIGKENGEFTIPATVTAIQPGAFEGASNLKRLVVSEGITTIGDGMFKNCVGIESIVLSSTVTEIGASAFEGCKSLSSVSLPSNLIVIGVDAFKNCTALTEITIPDKVTTIGGYAFNKSGLTSITVPASVTTLGTGVFLGCSSLESAYIQASITNGPNELFNGCGNLKTVMLPDGLQTIGEKMFYNCTSLEPFKIPDGVTTLGNNSFYNCKALTSIALPNGLQTIGEKAFYFCIGLTSITIPDSVTTIRPDAFMDCGALETVNIGKGLSLIGQDGKWANKTTCFIRCDKLKNIFVHDDNETFWDDNGVLYAKAPDSSVVLLHYGDDREKADCYEIPDGVTRIGSYAMYLLDEELGKLIIPVSVVNIGDEALNSPNIENIYYKGTKEQWSAMTDSSSYSNKTTITYNYTVQ